MVYRVYRVYGYFQKSIYGIYFTFPIIRSGGWESDLLYRVIETCKKLRSNHPPPPHPVWDTPPQNIHVGVCRYFQSDRGGQRWRSIEVPAPKKFPAPKAHHIRALWSGVQDRCMLYLTKTNAHAFVCGEVWRERNDKTKKTRGAIPAA